MGEAVLCEAKREGRREVDLGTCADFKPPRCLVFHPPECQTARLNHTPGYIQMLAAVVTAQCIWNQLCANRPR